MLLDGAGEGPGREMHIYCDRTESAGRRDGALDQRGQLFAQSGGRFGRRLHPFRVAVAGPVRAAGGVLGPFDALLHAVHRIVAVRPLRQVPGGAGPAAAGAAADSGRAHRRLARRSRPQGRHHEDNPALGRCGVGRVLLCIYLVSEPEARLEMRFNSVNSSGLVEVCCFMKIPLYITSILAK